MGSKAAAFRALAGNRAALLRVVTAYALFTLTEYAVWIAMLVYAYARGGAATAGLVALAQLAPAALLAPALPALAGRRSPAGPCCSARSRPSPSGRSLACSKG